MANVFDNVLRSALDVVRETLDVDSDGNVSFRTKTGRGSGAGVSIPADQFDNFVELMRTTQDQREELAQKQKETETETNTSDD